MALTDTFDAAPAPIPGTGRIDVLHALKALRRLLADKEDTRQVFEIMRALNGGSTARGYHRLLASEAGGRIAYRRVELAERLMDDAWLDGFAPGTLGAAYRDFVRAEQLSADGLAQISREGAERVDEPHPYAWFGRRTRDVHDIWHVLTGYGRDALGEACLVAFSYAQTKGLGWALIALGALSRTRKTGGYPMRRAIWEGWRRGKRAAWLLGEDYETLLAEPLDRVRARLGLTAPAVYERVPAALRNGVLDAA
jgi:ubiquinone biosynthesis protein COQ4